MTLQTNRNIPYYLAAIGLFILLKFGFTLADNNHLTYLLKPTNKLIGLLTNSQSVYMAENGYYHEKLNIIIDKSCSGFNFWILSFFLFTHLGVKHLEKHFYKVLAIPITLLIAYLLTIFVNTSRILASIIVQIQADRYLPTRPHMLIHEIVGIITNVTFLIIVCYIIEKILIKKQTYA